MLLAEGATTLVLSWASSELDVAREVPVLQNIKEFENRYMNRVVDVGTPGKSKQITLGRWWLQDPQRCQFEGLRFAPGQDEIVDGYLKLWRGFSVEPMAGSWELMHRHVLEALACGDCEAFDYIIKRAAWAVQNPVDLAEVALVFKGGRETGNAVQQLRQRLGVFLLDRIEFPPDMFDVPPRGFRSDTRPSGGYFG